MRILFITSRFPYPPLKGDRIRAYYPIKMLSNNHQVDLLSFEEQSISLEDIEEMSNYCKNIGIVKINRYKFIGLLFLGIISPFPSQVTCYFSKKMEELIKRQISENKYDIVHIVCGRLAGYSKIIDGTPKIIDWIDSFSLSTKRMYQHEENPVKRLLYYLEWKKIVKFEAKYPSKFNYSIITSNVDRNHMKNKITEVLTNGVDETLFKKSNIEKDIDIIFTGNMGYYSNINAVKYLVKDIFPKIIKRRPATNLYIVGSNPGKEILHFRKIKNIKITGYVDDIVKYLNRSRVFVAPMNSGAGIQNKILEAMACSVSGHYNKLR